MQGAYSHTEKEMRGQRMRHKITDREARACEVCLATFGTLFQGAYSFTEKECVVRECEVRAYNVLRLGSPTADPWKGGALVVLVVVFLCGQVCFKVRTHTQNKKCVVRECVIK